MKNYYEILGVDRNATDSEIKAAYRREAIKWHPDKWTGASDEEKKVAENRFKEVQEAYSYLSDPKKKESEFSFDPFEWFFDGGRERKTKATTIQINVGISIEEIYKGFDKTIYFNRTKRCSKCGGKQGRGIKRCPKCNGNGVILDIVFGLFGRAQTYVECPECKGTGKTFEEVCSECKGSGVETVRDSLHIKQEGVIYPGTTKIFNNIGNQDKDSTVIDGDIIVKFIPKLEENYYIDGFDVYEKLKVPVLDCLLGCEIKVKHPSGSIFNLRIPECCKDESKLLIRGRGLTPESNYIYVINQEMPEKLTEEQREVLKKLKN